MHGTNEPPKFKQAEACGGALTWIGVDASEIQPVVVLVNTKVALPAVIPVTIPVLVIVAIAGLLLCHVPPVEGDIWVVEPMQMELGPETVTTGFGYMVTRLPVELLAPQPTPDMVRVTL